MINTKIFTTFRADQISIMKKVMSYSVLFGLLFSVACDKSIADKQKDILIAAMTSGTWFVEKYLEGSTDITLDFSGYDFQFLENGTVNGIKDSTTTSGTWVGDIINYTIASTFPAGAPLDKLNGTWKITDSYWDYVKAEMTTPGGKNVLYLRKNP